MPMERTITKKINKPTEKTKDKKPRGHLVHNPEGYGPICYNKLLDEQFSKPYLQEHKNTPLRLKTFSIVESVREIGGRPPRTIVATAIRMASQELNIPLALQTISKQNRVTEVSIRNNIKHINKNK